MDWQFDTVLVFLLFLALTLFAVSTFVVQCPSRVKAYAKHLWLYLLFFTVGEVFTFRWATAVLALISFIALREYFSLIDIRPGDRLGILGGFFSIPLLVFTLLIDNHHIFLAAMPLFVFFFIAFLVTIGGDESVGTVFSIGVIGVGIFLFVFGNGLLGFLTLRSQWVGIIVVVNVSLSDTIAFCLYSTKRPFFQGKLLQYLVAIPVTVTTSILVMDVTSLPLGVSIITSATIPLLVAVSRIIMFHIEKDLGIARDYNSLRRGRLINSSSSLVLVTPTIFFLLNYLT